MYSYAHTQHSPVKWLWFLAAAGFVGVGLALADVPIVAGAMLGAAAAFIFVGMTLTTLSVQVTATELVVRFGPLPLFGTRVALSEIMKIERTRSRLLDGWGLHYFPGRGWTYNIWGRDSVCLRTSRKQLQIGSDDADRLFAVLDQQVNVGAAAG